MIYLDWAASAPPEPEALEAQKNVSERYFANPSSPHEAGRQAHVLLDRHRYELAALLGGGEVVFTSGATEANAAVLLSLLPRCVKAVERGKTVHAVMGAMEHSSIYEQARAMRDMGLSIIFVPADPDGTVSPARIAESLTPDTALVSLQTVNNETGVVQKVAEAVRAVRGYSSRGGKRILFHADAAQGFCKLPFNPSEIGVDAVSASAHKIGGPRGAGILWLAPGAGFQPLGAGGGQEGGKRPGTENLPGISAMAAAARIRMSRMEQELSAARKMTARLIEAVRGITGAVFFPEARAASPAGDARFSPYIISFGFPPLPGEVLVRAAEVKGFMMGTGSACSSKSRNRTRVLEAMGVKPETALSAVRVSIGHATRGEEIEEFAAALAGLVASLRSQAGLK